MPKEWTVPADELSPAMTRAVMRYAAQAISDQAILIAIEIEQGRLKDLGGPAALRLLATIVLIADAENSEFVGHG